MRILMINYEFPPIGGGGGNVTYYISKNLAHLGHDVHVITSSFKSLPKDEKIDGFHVHRVPVLRRSPNVCGIHEMLTYVISASAFCIRFAKKFQPDIVHVFFGIPSGPVAYVLKKLYNIPYVLFLGGRDVPRPHPDPPIYRLLYGLLMSPIKSIWANAKSVVACSKGLKDLALKTNAKVNINVIPDGVDLKKFYPIKKENSPKIVRILAIGRLVPRKGFDYLIRSLPNVVEQSQKDFCVEIIGDGPQLSELMQLAKKINVDRKVILSGAVPYDMLASKYQQADIFVLSSLAEGMPLVVLEAMASGLPIIATKVQGIDELVVDGLNGYLFNPFDYNTLSKHLIYMINNDEKRLSMGEQSQNIIKKYDWSYITDQYLKLYEKG